jgi:hypothetical protein
MFALNLTALAKWYHWFNAHTMCHHIELACSDEFFEDEDFFGYDTAIDVHALEEAAFMASDIIKA